MFTLQPYWTGDPCAAQPTVAIGVLAEVLLVIVFCIVELLGHCYFCGDGSETLFSQHLSNHKRPFLMNTVYSDSECMSI